MTQQWAAVTGVGFSLVILFVLHKIGAKSETEIAGNDFLANLGAGFLPTQLLCASTHSHAMCPSLCVCALPSSKAARVLGLLGVTLTQITGLLCVCVCQPLAGSLRGIWKPPLVQTSQSKWR